MRPRKKASCAGAAVAVLMVACAGGCQQAGAPYHRPLKPVADRLVSAYPDLSSGRFLIIADFEAVEQGAIFRISPSTAAAYVGLVTERARPETGAGALKVRLTSSEQELVVEDAGQGSWTLPRDWSRFHLLLISVYSPRPVSGLTFRARSGVEKPAEFQRGGMILREGWNLIRIDLGDLSERIDVSDVRQLRLGFSALSEPIEIYLDDIVLTDNAQDVLGSPQGQPGDLYVRSEGRRLRVGVVERFELVFARGQIVGWFDLHNDPDRLHNLTGGGPLGPLPVVLEQAGGVLTGADEAAGWEALGPAAETFQRLVEATPVRAVIWGERRFGSATASAPSEQSPLHRWVYTVYPTGKVYIEFGGTLSLPGFVPSVGYLVACADGEGFDRVLHPATGEPDDRNAESAAYVLYRRPEDSRPDMLVGFYRPAAAPKVKGVRHGRDPRLGSLFFGGDVEPVTVWAALLNVWPPDVDGPAQAEAILLDYMNPLPLTVTAGRLVRTDAGDFDNDGYNESRGHYTLEPDGAVLKLRLDGTRRMRFAPAFKVVDTSDADVWAYVDGLEIRPVARDAEGQAVFQVPDVIDRETLIEVTARKRAAAK